MTTSHRLYAVALAAATTAALVVPVSTADAAISPPPSASASSRTLSHCTSAEIENGKVKREVRLTDSHFVVTHSVRRRIARGTTFNRTVTMSSTNQVTASISGTTSVKADAGAFFAKAEASASVTLAGNKQKTTNSSLSESYTIPATNHDRLFVFYKGVQTYRFQAHKRVCNRGGEKDYSGSLSSWDTSYEDGNVLCPHARYRSGSLKYQIALSGGC